MDNSIIGTVGGVTFYEDSEYGDEVPMLIKYKGRYYDSEIYELPTFDEAIEIMTDLIESLDDGNPYVLGLPC
jgi:hypothetical protein